MPSVKPDQVEFALKNGSLKKVYLFDGPERFLKERAFEAILDKTLPLDQQSFNYQKFNGNDASGGDIARAGNDLPFLSSRRVIFIDNADALNKDDNAVLSESIPSWPESTLAVFIYDGRADLRNPLTAAVTDQGDVVTYWTPFPDRLVPWVLNETHKLGKKMEPHVAQMLVETGCDLQTLYNEISKLVLYVGAKPAITLTDISTYGLLAEEGDAQLLEEAIYRRETAEALHQATMLLDIGVREEILMGVVERAFRRIAIGQSLRRQNGVAGKDLAREAGLKLMSLQESFLLGMQRYSDIDVRKAFELMVKTDEEIKTGQIPPSVGLGLLVSNVTRKNEASLVRRLA